MFFVLGFLFQGEILQGECAMSVCRLETSENPFCVLQEILERGRGEGILWLAGGEESLLDV